MIVAIVGVLAFQVGWLIDTYNARRTAFEQSAKDALQNAIEDEKAVKMIRNMSKMVWLDKGKSEVITEYAPAEEFIYTTPHTTSSVSTVTITRPSHHMTMDSIVNMDITIDADSLLFSHSYSSDEPDSEVSVVTKFEVDTDMDINTDDFYSFEHEAIMIEDIASELERTQIELDDIVRNVVVKFGVAELNAERLDSIYRVRLFDRGITSGFVLSVSNEDSVQIMDDRNMVLIQPVNRFRNDDRVVNVVFPGFNRYILGEMWVNIAGSFLLVTIVVFIMIFMLSTILRQKKLSEMKNDFINNMTHELKTPVAAVSAALEGMEKFNVLDDPQKTQEYISMSQDELSRLTGMIEKVLSVARREKEGLKIHDEPFDLYEVACGLIKTYEIRHNDVMFDCMCPQGFLVDMDKLHITNLLNNLVDNAVKYNLREVDKSVSLNIFRHKGNIIMEVKDNGPGIPQQYQKYLFDKFYRVPTGNVHNVKGFGLGLNYVSAVVSYYNGEIELSSEIDKGSVFTIIIPDTTHE
jgi:signal transduction histidine kinase